jgi:uncharacterized protein
MKIRIVQLHEGLHSFDFVGTPQQLGLESHSAFSQDVGVHIELEKRKRHIHVVGKVRAVGHFECDRCLESFDRPVEDVFRRVFTTDPDFVDRKEDDDLVFLSPHTVELDFTVDARETLLLAVPMKVLCREDCRGLCPHCGANLNRESCTCVAEQVDPRWAALKDLFDSSHD